MSGPEAQYDLHPDVVCRVARPSGRVLAANRAARAFFGLEADDLDGHPLPDLDALDPQARDWIRTVCAAEGDGPWRTDLRARHASGEWRWLDVVGVATAPDQVLLTGRDVTARRRREDELHNIINTVPDPIFVKNDAFRWTVLNDACCAFIGQPREALIGKSDYEVFPEEEADVFREKDRLVFEHHLQTPHLNEESFTDADGVTFTIATKKRVFENPDGTRTLVGVIRDITEMKRLQEETEQRATALDDANHRLQESERLKDAFIANVSHELRTPLTLTLAPLESVLAGDFGPISDRMRDTCETMHNNAVRLLQMVTALLDFSKLEAGQLEVHREPVEVVALTRGAARDFEPLAARKGLTLAVDVLAERPVVSLDRYLFDRIAFNLLSNAVKFTPSGGRIDLELRIANGQIRLTVRDTGIGIPSHDVPHLFDRFRQVDRSVSQRYEGTGLGLALVQQFAHLLDGEVSVDTEVGVGSAFTLTCRAPVSDEAVTPVEHVDLAQHFATDSIETVVPTMTEGMPRVLVVEDNEALGTYVLRLLEDTAAAASFVHKPLAPAAALRTPGTAGRRPSRIGCTSSMHTVCIQSPDKIHY